MSRRVIPRRWFASCSGAVGVLAISFTPACGDDGASGAGGAGGGDASASGGSVSGGGGGLGPAGGSGGAAMGGMGGASGGGAGGVGGTGGVPDAGSAGAADGASEEAGITSPEAGQDASVAPEADAATDAGDAEAGPLPCDLPGVVQFQGQGTVTGTGTYSGSSPENARDGDTTTSWWTEATFGSQLYTWQIDQEECLDSISITNTAGDQLGGGAWAGRGFDQVIVRVANLAGEIVYTVTQPLAGEPDPSPTFTVGGIKASRIELEFSGFPNGQSHGGFSELQVVIRQ